MLLTREQFREQVFKRDNYKCVVCQYAAQDVHHIIERRLWDDGGYYLNNGVSLCGKCHIKAEQTIIGCGQLRELANIKELFIPSHLYKNFVYDKWSNIILPNGNRLKGELFFDSGVQKVLKDGNVLGCFSSYVKYPRTYHLPWSGLVTSDDRMLRNVENFKNKEVVVTVKLDGENTTIYRDHIHARSLDSRNHPSRNWVKNLHGSIAHNIPEGWRICGENVYAKHSIQYNNLCSYFFVFSIWDEKNVCLDWDTTLEWCSLLGLEFVYFLYSGMWDEQKIKEFNKIFKYQGNDVEGYVVRLKDSFTYGSFRKSVAKYVHPQFREDLKDRHNWMRQQVTPNKLYKF